MLTTYFKNLLADHIWHTESETTLPAEYYLALSSTEPFEDGTGVTEPDTTSGYARVKVSDLAAAVDGSVSNVADLKWPEVTTNQGAVTYWAVFDAVTDGNLLMSEAFTEAKHLDTGTSIICKAGKLTLDVLGA